MRINDNNMTGPGASGLNRSQGPEPPGREGSAAAGVRESGARDDRVDLSRLAARLNALDLASPAREAYVDKLAALYQTGRYEPDAEAIAGAIVEESMQPGGPA